MSRAATTARRRPHTAFVLAGGASLGAMQVGMLALAFIIDVTRSSAVRRAEYNPAGRVAPCSGSTSGIWTSSLTPVMF